MVIQTERGCEMGLFKLGCMPKVGRPKVCPAWAKRNVQA